MARLMREAGLEGVSCRRRARATWRTSSVRLFIDLAERDFAVGGPDQLWLADITCVPTWLGFLYGAVLIDAWSRKVVG